MMMLRLPSTMMLRLSSTFLLGVLLTTSVFWILWSLVGQPISAGDAIKATHIEFSRMRQQGGIAAAQLMEGSRRGMRVALLKESDRLEHSLSMLATVGSTSPYVGLFGTVWGIMNAFHGLGNVQQATLAMVAPGIAEALIATAMGLFAAIPAVVAYNRYADQVSRME